ncbi:hypothetical protein M758_1G226400 [Ceratodon purpureus]|nr:hypothetical protein M758_1G226400 [Ceratodon purpureus]
MVPAPQWLTVFFPLILFPSLGWRLVSTTEGMRIWRRWRLRWGQLGEKVQPWLSFKVVRVASVPCLPGAQAAREGMRSMA